MKKQKIITNLLNSNTFSALIGVVIGGLITGYISYKTQNLLIESQKNEFKNQYLIKKNDELKTYLNEYIENLFIITQSEAEETAKREIVLNRMSVISTKISLLNNPTIGVKCSKLNNELEHYINNRVSSDNAEKAKSELLDYILNELEKLELEIKGVYEL